MYNQFHTMYFTKEIQQIVKRAARKLSREYADRGIEREDLEQQAYICYIELMDRFKHIQQIEDFAHPPGKAIGYIGQFLPMRLKNYVWQQAGIRQTKEGYKAEAVLIEYNPALHDQEAPMESSSESNEHVAQALEEMTYKQREVIVLEFFQNVEDVATVLQLKPGTYRKRKMDALEAMKRSLGGMTLQEALAG